MNEVPQRALTVREQAEMEVSKELAVRALSKMKDMLRQRKATEQILKGIDIQIQDLERQIDDGTL